ncbi:unnamed protein product [Euphydryas editha]|uniref:Uncharacterized protein n=1 Tax=Euphydryas editha TaxID=104508 RepID=A0AAU9VAV5_EUPED|nr:unnamed protein product [Euphydryas editha]
MNTEKFATYCHDTTLLYVELYSWHPMSPTVHKILIHGPLVVEHAILPIGTLSEEAAEARNKHFRQFRSNYSRKFSREQCNLDVLNVLLLTSDPYLPSIRLKPQKRSKPFSFEATEMLLPSEVDASNEVIESTEDFVQEANYSFDEEGWQTSD